MKIAIIADLHSNIYALEAVLKDLNKDSVERIFVAGDIIGYYYWPEKVVKLLMEDSRFYCIRGNHEQILGEVLNSEVAAVHYRRKYGSGYEVCKTKLTQGQMQWLLGLPTEISSSIGGVDLYMSHGGISNSDQYIYPNSSNELISDNYSNSEFTIFGHTHYPFVHSCSGKTMINPGSVGQPRDVGGSASYVVINCENKCIQFKRRAFDVAPVIEASNYFDPELPYLSEIMSR